MALRQYLPQKPYLPPIRVERKTPQPGMLDYIAGLTNAYAQYQGQNLKFKQFEALQARQAMLDNRYDAKTVATAEALEYDRARQGRLDAAGATTRGLQNKNLIQSMQIAKKKAERERQLREYTGEYLVGDAREVLTTPDEEAFGDDEFDTRTEIQRNDDLLAQMIKSGASLDYISDLKGLTGETTTSPFEYIEKPTFTKTMEQLAGTRNVDATNFNKALKEYINPMLEDLQGSIGLPSDQFEGSWLDNYMEGHNWGMGEDRVDKYKREQFEKFKMQLQDYLAETSQSYAKGDQGIAQQIGQIVQSGLENAGQDPEEGFYGNTSAPELAQIMENLRSAKLQGTPLTSIQELRDREEKRARLAFLAKKK